MEAVKTKLGLPQAATQQEVVDAIDQLQRHSLWRQAGKLVARAISEGRIPVAHHRFWLREALNDFDAAGLALNEQGLGRFHTGNRKLSRKEKIGCDMFALDPHVIGAFLAYLETDRAA